MLPCSCIYFQLDSDTNDPTFNPSGFLQSSDPESDDTTIPLKSLPSTEALVQTVKNTNVKNHSVAMPVTSQKKNIFKADLQSTKNASEVSETSQKEEIYVKSSNKRGGKRAWDKKYYCVYCFQPYAKIARHFEDKHSRESEVDKMIKLAPTEKDGPDSVRLKRKLRKEICDSLRKKGNYNHNIAVLQQGRGELIVKRCPPKITLYTSYLPCEFCLDFYYKKDLHRHMKTCKMRKTKLVTRKVVRVQGSAAMLLPVHPDVSEALNRLFIRMRVDDVSLALKLDPLIIKYGNVLCRKHYNNDDQTYHISNKLRELGRLLIKLRSSNEEKVKCFQDVINPELFPNVVIAVTELCGWDEMTKTVETPSLGIKLGQLLTKVAFLVKGDSIIHGIDKQRKKADDFLSLIEMKWNDEISKISRTELETRKWNKPKLIPLTEDLQKLRGHLTQVIKSSMEVLVKDNSVLSAWRDLCSAVLACIILLNRRRAGEASKLEVKHVVAMQQGTPHDDVKESLSPFELKLCEYFKRIEIRGKRGRKVPVLITKQLEGALNVIINLRGTVGVNENNKYVFAIPTMQSLQYLRGSDALRKHVRLCELRCPQAISSTKLRKHIATLCQILNLQKRELEMLANFLGHDVTTHKEFYRLPEDTMQLAKCGKLLMLMDQGKLGQFAGQKLDDINIDLEGWLSNF